MKFKTLFATLALGLGVLFAGAQAQAAASGSPVLDRIQERGELVVGTTGDMPPLNMTTKDGKVIGMEPNLAKFIADSMGVELKLETMEFYELLPALTAGKIDMVLSGMAIIPQRNLKAAFVGPYFASGKCILSKEKTLASAEDASDLNKAGTKLAALKGSTSEMFVKEAVPAATLMSANNTEEGVQMVIDGKADALIADYNTCVVTLLQNPDKDLVSIISLLSYEPIGIAVPPNDPLLVNWLDNFLNRLQVTGELEELRKHWFEKDFWLKELSSTAASAANTAPASDAPAAEAKPAAAAAE